MIFFLNLLNFHLSLIFLYNNMVISAENNRNATNFQVLHQRSLGCLRNIRVTHKIATWRMVFLSNRSLPFEWTKFYILMYKESSESEFYLFGYCRTILRWRWLLTPNAADR